MTPDLMLRTIFAKALYDQRRAAPWWALGIVAFVGFSVAFWPTVRDQGETFNQAIRALPPAITAFIGDISEITSPMGYLQGRLFSLALPLLLIVYAIGRGSDLIAGEEERGHIDALLADEPRRVRVVLQKAAALATGTAALGIVAWASTAVGSVAFGMNADQSRIALGVLGATLLALAYGCIAFAWASATGRRGAATGIATALAVASWIVDGLARLTDALDVLLPFSPHHHYTLGAQLVSTTEPWRLLVLAAIAIAGVAVAAWGFQRRDVNV